MPNLTANLIPSWPILVPLGPSWRQHRLQESSQWSSTGGLDRICGHLGAKRAPKSSTPPKWRSFSHKITTTCCFHSKNEPHGILKRIYRLKRKRNIRSRTDPGFPTPGARMTVVYTNSLKLINRTTRTTIIFCIKPVVDGLKSIGIVRFINIHFLC